MPSRERVVLPQYVKVDVLKAKDLPSLDINGFSDPYVKVYYGAQKAKTPVIQKSLNPEWNHECNFKWEPGTTHIEFHIYDRDAIGSDEFIGIVKLPTKALQVGAARMKKWCKIKDKQGHDGQGQLKVAVAVTAKGESEEVDERMVKDLKRHKKLRDEPFFDAGRSTSDEEGRRRKKSSRRKEREESEEEEEHHHHHKSSRHKSHRERERESSERPREKRREPSEERRRSARRRSPPPRSPRRHRSRSYSSDYDRRRPRYHHHYRPRRDDFDSREFDWEYSHMLRSVVRDAHEIRDRVDHTPRGPPPPPPPAYTAREYYTPRDYGAAPYGDPHRLSPGPAMGRRRSFYYNNPADRDPLMPLSARAAPKVLDDIY